MNIEYTCIKGKSKGIYKNATEEKPDSLAKEALEAVRKAGEEYLKHLIATEEKPEPTPSVVYPEIDTPDFDYPVEIDYPDYDTDYGLCSESMFGANEQMFGANDQSVDLEIDSLDFESIVLEVRQDIAENKIFDKFLHYMDLLKVDPREFDDFLICEFSCEEMEKMIEGGEDEALHDMEVKVNGTKVFDRLFSLYCPDSSFVIPPKTNYYLREYVDRLEPDGRYFPKKQLSVFGGCK